VWREFGIRRQVQSSDFSYYQKIEEKMR